MIIVINLAVCCSCHSPASTPQITLFPQLPTAAPTPSSKPSCKSPLPPPQPQAPPLSIPPPPSQTPHPTTVRSLCHYSHLLSQPHHIFRYGSSLPVIIGYFACACASARLIILFNRMPPQQQALMWATYPTFLRFVLVGSITGIFTWSTNIPSLLFFFTSDEISRGFTSNGSCPTSSSCVAYQNAISGYYTWQTANFVFYPLEVAVIICCKLLTVDPHLLNLNNRTLNPNPNSHELNPNLPTTPR